MQKKLLVICGPTATGKTNLALSLAKKFDGELVSADSRQVYKGLDIGTGKDIPKNFKFRASDLESNGFSIGYYTDGKIRLWGYDLVEPTKEFSVGQYLKIAQKIIKNIWKRKKLPTIVGGSGLYIKGVLAGIPSAEIPKNEKLRKSLEKKSAGELFGILTGVAPVKAASMNESDRKNPRRLIRAIEIYKFESKHNRKNCPKPKLVIRIADRKPDILIIGLKATKKVISDNIEKRVRERIGKGQEQEIEKLLLRGVNWKSQSMQSIGYKEWKNYFDCLAKNTYETCKTEKKLVIGKWIQDERNYVKRQITWFKKDIRINWFDIENETWRENVEKLVRKWHNNSS